MAEPQTTVDKLKSERGANITYLRHKAQIAATIPRTKGLAEQIERACDDIEAYREIVGLVINKRRTKHEDERLVLLLEAMTWGNP